MAASKIACGGNALTSVSAALEEQRERKRKSYGVVDTVVCQGVRRSKTSHSVYSLFLLDAVAARPLANQRQSTDCTSILSSLSVHFGLIEIKLFHKDLVQENNYL